MKYRAAFFALTSIGLIASLSLAQDQQPAKSIALGEGMSWTKGGTYEWRRPDNVRYVLIRACGGGGGGGGEYSVLPRPAVEKEGGTAAGGGGGAGAAVASMLLGPLTAPSYAVVIGHGGAGGTSTSKAGARTKAGSSGEAGTATRFEGPDLSFETPGGQGGRAGAMQTRISTEANLYEYFVLRAPSTGGAYPGGGSAQNGARGLLGLGGQGDVRGNSGGGGGSLGKGGAGGAINSAGSDGGACAGGGGAGFVQSDDGSVAGGRGGDGSLTLLSLTSVGA